MQDKPPSSFANSIKYISGFQKGFVSPPKILKRSTRQSGSPHNNINNNLSKTVVANKYDDHNTKTPSRNCTKNRMAQTATCSKLSSKETNQPEVINFNHNTEKENTPKIMRDINFYTKTKRDCLDDTLNLSMNSDKNKLPKSPHGKNLDNMVTSTPFSKSNRMAMSESKRDAELGLSNERLLNVLYTLKEEKNNLIRDIENKEKQKKEDIIKRAESLKLKIESSIKDMDLLGAKSSFHSGFKSEKFLIKPDQELAISRSMPVKQQSLTETPNQRDIPVSAFNQEDEIKHYKDRNTELTNFVNMLIEKNNTLQAALQTAPHSTSNNNCGVINSTGSNNQTTFHSRHDTRINDEPPKKSSQRKEIELWVESSNPTKDTDHSEEDVIGEQKKYNIRDINKESLDGYSKGEVVRISLILKHELEMAKKKLSLSEKGNDYLKKKMIFLEEQVDVKISDRDKNLIKSFENYILGLLAENDKIARAFEDTHQELEKFKREFNIVTVNTRSGIDEESLIGGSSDGIDRNKEKGL